MRISDNALSLGQIAHCESAEDFVIPLHQQLAFPAWRPYHHAHRLRAANDGDR